MRELRRGIVWGIVVLLLLFSGVADAQLMDSAWAKFQHGLDNTGQSQYPSISNGSLKWSFSYGTSYYKTGSKPAIDSSGVIYIGNRDNNLYAIYPNGTLKWSYSTGQSIYSSPAIDSNGIIYVGSEDNNLYAIYPNGTKKWNYTTGNIIYYSSPAIDLNGIIYVGSDDNNLYAIYPNGTKKWNFTGTDDFDTSPAIDSNGIIYVKDYSGKLYAIYPNGTEKWNINTIYSIYDGSLVIGSDGIIYDATQNGVLHAIYPNGTEKWNFVSGSIFRTSPSIGLDGMLYIGDLNGVVHAIYPNGTEKWNIDIGLYIFSSAAIDSNGVIYIGERGNPSGSFYAIYPNGTIKWSMLLGSYIFSSPAIDSNGVIYIRNEDGNLYAFDSQAPAPPSFDPSGYVNDSLGNPLASVNVTLSNATASASNTSNVLGFWNLSGQLSDGLYNYSAQKTGYTTTTGSETFTNGGSSLVNITLTVSTITVSCPIGWCYLAQNYTNKTLLELDNLFSTDTIQGHYNATSQKYESHRTGYNFNQNVTVAQKEGYYYYFSTATDITTTPGSTPSITLKQGWNLVGNYGTTNRTLTELKTSIGANATQAQYYNRTSKTWVSTGTQSVPAMESFMVYVTASTEWVN